MNEECALRQHPTLKQRMENLGLSTASLPPDLTQTAAEYYFHNHYAKIVVMSDENWCKKQRQNANDGHIASLRNRIVNFAMERTDNLPKDSKAKVV